MNLIEAARELFESPGQIELTHGLQTLARALKALPTDSVVVSAALLREAAEVLTACTCPDLAELLRSAAAGEVTS
jgi:hypothetical protein